MTPADALMKLNEREHELSQAAIRYAAAHQDAFLSDEAAERMLAAREALLDAADEVNQAEVVWFTISEAEEETEQ